MGWACGRNRDRWGAAWGTLERNVSKKIGTVVIWVVAVVAVAVQLWAYYVVVWQPGLENVMFTNLTVVEWVNRLPWVSLAEPSVVEQYCAFSPKFVGLLAFWPLLWVAVRHSLGDFSVWQRVLSGVVRMALLALLVLALVDIEKVSETERVSVVYVVDVSDSVSDGMMRAAEAEIRGALASRRDGVDVQVVAFSDAPRVVPVDPEFAGLERFAGAEGMATDIESAMRFGYVLFRENHVRRMVLLSDGLQTHGDVLSEAARARAQGIRVDVRHLEYDASHEVLIRSVDVRGRDSLRVGKPFEIVVEVESTKAVSAHFSFYKNDVLEASGSREVGLEPGANFISLETQADAPGELRIRFELDGLDPGADRFAQNNVLSDRLMIQGKPRVLYLEDNANSASYLQRALAGYGGSSGQDFEVDVRASTGFPSSMSELSKYSAVILGDVPRQTQTGRVNLTTEDMNRLRDYVRVQGGGFIALGGDQAFALGGYEQTPVEAILPVEFKNDVPRPQKSAAVALVIDKSGSMDHGKLEIAKEAAKASVGALKPQDRVMVIGFDDVPTVVVPATRAVNRYSINTKIAGMRPLGGTNIRDALELTYLELSMVSASSKLVILLSDGGSSYAGIDALVREMSRARITVSTVAMGDADVTLLGRIANLGKGRMYVAREASSVPRIFVEETTRVANPGVIEEPFVPHVARSHEMIRGVTLQTLLGYVATKAKPGSQTILTAPGGAPILAHWSLGTGKTTAFTSDAKNRWASAWIRQSASFARFWAQVVRATMKTEEETRFEMQVVRESERVRVMVDAVSEEDAFLNGLDVEATIRDPEGRERTLSLGQTAPGFYENTFELSGYGTYEAEAVLSQSGRELGTARRTFSFPYAQEYASPEPDFGLLDAVAQTSGGRVDVDFGVTSDPEGEKTRSYSPVWPWFLWLSLGALVLDVALRRIRFGRRT